MRRNPDKVRTLYDHGTEEIGRTPLRKSLHVGEILSFEEEDEDDEYWYKYERANRPSLIKKRDLNNGDKNGRKEVKNNVVQS